MNLSLIHILSVILFRIAAVSSSGFSNIGCLFLISVNHSSYFLSSCFISRGLFDSFYYGYSFGQDIELSLIHISHWIPKISPMSDMTNETSPMIQIGERRCV